MIPYRVRLSVCHAGDFLVPVDCALCRRSAGKLFQILAPATAKFRVPRLVFVPVTARQPDTADRRCRLAIDVAGAQSTARYGGTSPWMQTLVDQRRRNVLKSDTAHIVFLVDTAS